MSRQGTLFAPSTGAQLRDYGIQRAINTADIVFGDWSEQAFKFLENYLGTVPKGHSFMVEDIRTKSIGVVPEPPSRRAWGGIIVKAKNKGLIENIGTRSVVNPRAHRCWAAIWVKIT